MKIVRCCEIRPDDFLKSRQAILLTKLPIENKIKTAAHTNFNLLNYNVCIAHGFSTQIITCVYHTVSIFYPVNRLLLSNYGYNDGKHLPNQTRLVFKLDNQKRAQTDNLFQCVTSTRCLIYETIYNSKKEHQPCQPSCNIFSEPRIRAESIKILSSPLLQFDRSDLEPLNRR